MQPTEPTPENPPPPGDPIRMALGALVASCYAGYRRAKQGTHGSAHAAGEAGTSAAAPGSCTTDGAAPHDPPEERPKR